MMMESLAADWRDVNGFNLNQEKLLLKKYSGIVMLILSRKRSVWHFVAAKL